MDLFCMKSLIFILIMTFLTPCWTISFLISVCSNWDNRVAL